jgi:hypothetical protein
MIYSREHVRRAVARAMLSHETMGREKAIEAVAELLGLDVATVRECCEQPVEVD